MAIVLFKKEKKDHHEEIRMQQEGKMALRFERGSLDRPP